MSVKIQVLGRFLRAGDHILTDGGVLLEVEGVEYDQFGEWTVRTHTVRKGCTSFSVYAAMRCDGSVYIHQQFDCRVLSEQEAFEERLKVAT